VVIVENEKSDVFPGEKWLGMQELYFMCAKMLRRWCIIQKEEVAAQLLSVAKEWELR
jgi:hypothetical protein